MQAKRIALVKPELQLAIIAANVLKDFSADVQSLKWTVDAANHGTKQHIHYNQVCMASGRLQQKL